MKKVWIFLLIAAVLFTWTLVRERFEATPSIQAPPYDKDDKIRVFGLLNNADQTYLMTNMKVQDPTNGAVYDALINKGGLSNDEKAKLKEVKDKLEEKAGALLTPSIEKFFNDVFKPATVPITPQRIDTFLTVDTNTLVSKEMRKRILTTYFISQSGVATYYDSQGNATTNTAYNNILASLGQGQGYLNTGTGGTGGTGGSGGSGGGAGGAGGGAGAGGSGGSGGGAGAGGAGGSGGGSGAGGSGGGGSGGGSGGGGSGGSGGGVLGGLNKVFGPLFTGFGDPGAQGLVDTSKTNVYPELLGGRGSNYGAAGAAGGRGGFGFGLGGTMTNPNLDYKGSIPSSGGLGSDENSQFFPYSRQPGDMDTIQDPYRVSQQFASSSYSFKTEPVPFLTDFSAFQR
jgi:hypothetical protein